MMKRPRNVFYGIRFLNTFCDSLKSFELMKLVIRLTVDNLKLRQETLAHVSYNHILFHALLKNLG